MKRRTEIHVIARGKKRLALCLESLQERGILCHSAPAPQRSMYGIEVAGIKVYGGPQIQEKARRVLARQFSNYLGTFRRPRFSWDGVETAKFSIYKAAEGGLGLYAITMLRDAGIPVRQCGTVYMGHVGIEVPVQFERRAERLVL